MKASKRNEERMTLSEKGWMMNGMAYEKCKACVTCGEHYYRRVSSDEPCCSTACLTNYRAKQKIAKAKATMKENARIKGKKIEEKAREAATEKAYRRYTLKLEKEKVKDQERYDQKLDAKEGRMEVASKKKVEKARKDAYRRGYDAGKDDGMEDSDIMYEKGKKLGKREGKRSSAAPDSRWKQIPTMPLYMSRQGIVYDEGKIPVPLKSRGDDKRLTFKYKKKEYFVHETVLFLFGGPRPIGCYAGHKFSSAVTMNEVGQRNLMYMKKAY